MMRRVFISHSSKDKRAVREIAADLEHCGIDVWFDEWELAVGDSLIEAISRGIDRSSWLAVVLTPHSVSSAWVQKELSAALARELAKKKVYVLPILLSDCRVPTFLRDKVYADFRTDYRKGFESLLRRIDPKRFSGERGEGEASMGRILGWERPDGSYVYGRHPESF